MSTPARGFTINVFVPTGDPAGLRIVEKTNWTGKGLVCPRNDYATVRGRPEFKLAGVYVLVGRTSDGEADQIYVGEGDPIGPRLDSHAKLKDFWNSVYCFVSKDSSLNKAHVQYLESRLVELADEAKRSVVENGNRPDRPTLAEATAAEAEVFLQDVLLCFPLMGLSVFSLAENLPKKTATKLQLTTKGITAYCNLTSEGFVVTKGSQAVLSAAPSTPQFVKTARESLLKRGVLIERGGLLVFEVPYTFDSASTAAAVVMGRNANGLIEWRSPEGVTLKDLRQAGND